MDRFNSPLIARIPLLLALLCPVLTPAANHTVEVGLPFFNPRELTIQVGDTVTWTNKGQSHHNVVADDGSFRCAQGCDHLGGNGEDTFGEWSFSLTFNESGRINYHCEPHADIGMRGVLIVSKDEVPSLMPINFGHSGSWYNEATDGQGLNIEVVMTAGEPALVVVYWFTFSEPGSAPAAGKQVVSDQRWFIAVGDVPAEGDEIPLEVFISTGGRFDTATPAPSQEAVGTATLAFTSCAEGTLAYDMELRDAAEQSVSGEIPIQRLTPDVMCEGLAGQ